MKILLLEDKRLSIAPQNSTKCLIIYYYLLYMIKICLQASNYHFLCFFFRKRREWDVYEPIVDLLSNEEVEALEAREERSART